jgi:hypothetical protein
MTLRIIFNGQEYASVEAMPENVRNAYLTVLKMLRDTDSDGIPDVLEDGSAGPTIGVREASVSLNGRSLGSVGGLPEWTRRLAERALFSSSASGSSLPLAADGSGWLAA